ncbi:unnamed protein product [marine sediment metagenome]|uniref:Protein kinase domain-containing protein n=1 Tax=marine sediment metagenome TaxID=412755 RepID=X0YIK8_9ZZZZ
MKDITIGNVFFKVSGKLGKGSFGKVYRVTIEGDPKEYALKVIKNPANEGIKSLRELDIMGRIRHPYLMNAVMIVADYTEKITKKNKIKEISRLGILMEIAEKDLYIAIYDKNFRTSQRLETLKQISIGCQYLHDSNYLHLDIKPLNILLFKNNVAKLTDFGLSLHTNDKNIADFPLKLITVDHRSPQVLLGERTYTAADDVWSLGITFIEVLSKGKSLFSGFKSEEFTDEIIYRRILKKLSPKNINKTLNKLLSNLSEPTKTNAKLTISRMLAFEPFERATLSEVINSSLFSDISTYVSPLETYRIQPFIKSGYCDIYSYEGFDTIVRICLRLPISLETFFLAVDIYQRFLIYRFPIVGNFQKDYNNIVYSATLSLYLGIKMLEPFFPDIDMMVALASKLISSKNLIIGEAIITNSFGGIFYPNNLFTNSSTLRRLLEAFDICRDSRIYSKIDLEEWKRLNDQEELTEGKYDKYTPFNKFIVLTSYYQKMSDPSLKYIKDFFENDPDRYK